MATAEVIHNKATSDLYPTPTALMSVLSPNRSLGTARDVMLFKHETDWEYVLDGLRQAGIP